MSYKEFDEQLKQFRTYLDSEFESLEATFPDSLVLPFEEEIKSIAVKMQASGLRKFAPSFIVGAIAQALHRVAFNESLTKDLKMEHEWIGYSVEDLIDTEVPVNISNAFRRFSNPKYYNTAILLVDNGKVVKSPVMYSEELPKFINTSLPMSKNWANLPKLEKPFMLLVRRLYETESGFKSIPNIPANAISTSSLGQRFIYVLDYPHRLNNVWDYFEKPEWLKQ